MAQPNCSLAYFCLAAWLSATTALATGAVAQTPSRNSAPPTNALDLRSQSSDSAAEAELASGISLTKRGQFAEAIPHFLTAKGRVNDEYAVDFNLALCYVGTAQFRDAVRVLEVLRRERPADANVENLLAQAYVGQGQPEQAFDALRRAAALAPKNEKQYLFVADACGDQRDYALGLRVVTLALQNLPESARLHYQHGYFLAMLDHFDEARPEFARAVSLAPGSEVAFLAAAQSDYFAGNLEGAIREGREGVKEGREDYLLLTILGDALIRSGATPGTPEFQEARGALEKAVALRPGYVAAQIALGAALAMNNQTAAAVEHLEKARQLDSRNPSVYAHLAVAYRKLGQKPQAEAMLAILAQLNAEEAAKIYSAPGERKAIPGVASSVDRPHP